VYYKIIHFLYQYSFHEACYRTYSHWQCRQECHSVTHIFHTTGYSTFLKKTLAVMRDNIRKIIIVCFSKEVFELYENISNLIIFILMNLISTQRFLTQLYFTPLPEEMLFQSRFCSVFTLEIIFYILACSWEMCFYFIFWRNVKCGCYEIF
jgi:hypothetical protein